MNERGEILTLFMIAFAVFIALLAGGIAIDRTIHPPPCDPTERECWMKLQREKLDLFDCPNTGVPPAQCFLDDEGHVVELTDPGAFEAPTGQPHEVTP